MLLKKYMVSNSVWYLKLNKMYILLLLPIAILYIFRKTYMKKVNIISFLLSKGNDFQIILPAPFFKFKKVHFWEWGVVQRLCVLGVEEGKKEPERIFLFFQVWLNCYIVNI